MRPLPVGTLTLLFSDIEGSTSMLSRLGTRWGEALSAQRRIMRATFEEFDGIELGTEGDSFFVVFTSAHQALAAAVAAHRRLHDNDWPGGVAIKVRIGIHTGEPQRHEDGYIGIDVHRAARIAATASGGQTVVSAATHAILEGHTGDVTLRDLGWHRLKDLPDQERLYDVVVSDLPHEHPPLRSLGTSANLPAYTTDLLGREAELTAITDAIEPGGARLVTLTGPGGTGKTRLAVAVANQLQQRVPCDIFFVPLHTADRAALLWSGIAETVGAPSDAELMPDERALRFLRDRKVFLVLDNLEQIADADVAVSQLLTQAPEVAVLATSRRPLHLVDEHQYPVSTLAVPEEVVDVQAAQQSAAVDLFVQRARMVKPHFRLDEGNVADVVALCRRLDGLPLAIELAAARARLLSPKALLTRLDDRLGESVTNADRASRQRTLRAAISWSYDLLDPEDQRVFRLLGIFSSTVDLEAVEFVADADGRDPLDVVAHLVDVSLLEIVEGPDGEPKVGMLETIRRFAREQLSSAGEYDAVRLRHARWCVEIADDVTGMLGGPNQMRALDRIEVVEEDIRAALDWCLAPTSQGVDDRHELGLQLLRPMSTYWYRFGYVAEGRGWHDRALRLVESGVGADSLTVLDALHGQGILAVQQNDLVTGTHALERSLEMAIRLGDPNRESRERNSLGIARRESGDVEGARALIERSLEIAREIGSANREATALSNIVHVYMDIGDYPAAVVAAREGIAADEARHDPWGVTINKANLVSAMLNAEGPEAAFEAFADVAPAALELGDIELSVDVVETSAAVWAGLGDPERAATLLGAAENQREAAGIPRPQPDQHHLDRFIGPARSSVEAQQWERAYRIGRGMTLEAAVARGLAGRAKHERTPTAVGAAPDSS